MLWWMNVIDIFTLWNFSMSNQGKGAAFVRTTMKGLTSGKL